MGAQFNFTSPTTLTLINTDFDPDADNVDISFGVSATWRVNNATFPASGIEQQKIGIVQVIKLDISSNNLLASWIWGTNGWEIDSENGSGFYGTPHGAGAVSGDPTTMAVPISFEDQPALGTAWNFTPCRVQYDFETYVVGITGPEGLKHETESSSLYSMERLTDITVYAGVGWGATFTYTKSNGHYHRDTIFLF